MARDTYTTQDWQDSPQETTPINSERLGHIENGIKTAMDNRALKEIYDDNAISMGRKSGGKTGSTSIAIGLDAEASSSYSFSFGNYTVASQLLAFAHGNRAKANGNCSHAEGYQTEVSGENSHVEGCGTLASSENSHVEGKYNIEDKSKKYAHIIGNGNSKSERSNAYTLDWQGVGWFQKDVQCGGTGQDSEGIISLLDLSKRITELEEKIATLMPSE